MKMINAGFALRLVSFVMCFFWLTGAVYPSVCGELHNEAYYHCKWCCHSKYHMLSNGTHCYIAPIERGKIKYTMEEWAKSDNKYWGETIEYHGTGWSRSGVDVGYYPTEDTTTNSMLSECDMSYRCCYYRDTGAGYVLECEKDYRPFPVDVKRPDGYKAACTEEMMWIKVVSKENHSLCGGTLYLGANHKESEECCDIAVASSNIEEGVSFYLMPILCGVIAANANSLSW